jgi:hypothetical protein
LAASGWARRRGAVIGAVGVLAIAAYLVELLESIWAPARELARFSPFHYYAATGILAGTAPGPPLEGRRLRRYIDKRRNINRAFERYGYDISAMMKPWSFGPYGVDKQVLGTNRENRNRLTANATAALMLWIARRGAPGADAMLKLLERPLAPQREDENQVKEFIGAALPEGSRLWSKAGWTSEVRHDAAYVELPDRNKFILVIFTRGPADDVTLIPAIARNVLERR